MAAPARPQEELACARRAARRRLRLRMPPYSCGAEPHAAEVIVGAAFLGMAAASQRTVISATIPCATCGGPPLRLLTKHSRAYLPGLSRASSVICFAPPAILAV